MSFIHFINEFLYTNKKSALYTSPPHTQRKRERERERERENEREKERYGLHYRGTWSKTARDTVTHRGRLVERQLYRHTYIQTDTHVKDRQTDRQEYNQTCI